MTKKTTPTTTNDFFRNTVCLSVTFHRPASKRNGNLDSVSTKADKEELILSKRIFNSEAYQTCHRINLNTRRWIESRSVPSPLRNGTYLIPVGLVDSVYEKLDEAIEEYRSAADEFAKEYPSLIKKWEEKLADQFDASNYPDAREIRRRFFVSKIVLDFSPTTQGGIDQNAEIQEAINEIRAALRASLLDLVSRLSDMLTDTTDGKKKRFSKKALERFSEWMTLFPDRLVVDDPQLVKLAEQAKKVLEGKKLDELRDVDKVRTQVRGSLEKVGGSLQKLLKDCPSRSFGFDD